MNICNQERTSYLLFLPHGLCTNNHNPSRVGLSGSLGWKSAPQRTGQLGQNYLHSKNVAAARKIISSLDTHRQLQCLNKMLKWVLFLPLIVASTAAELEDGARKPKLFYVSTLSTTSTVSITSLLLRMTNVAKTPNLNSGIWRKCKYQHQKIFHLWSSCHPSAQPGEHLDRVLRHLCHLGHLRLWQEEEEKCWDGPTGSTYTSDPDVGLVVLWWWQR